MPKPRDANCIFCEDIRLEIGNKYSLMGVFAADLAFPLAPPLTLPKFGVVVWLLFDVGDAPKQITIRILIPPNKTELVKMVSQGDFELQFPFPPDELSRGVLRFMLPVMNLTLTEEGFIEVMVETERETFRAGRLYVRFNVKPEEVGLSPAPPTG
jgi:hypothetical protein